MVISSTTYKMYPVLFKGIPNSYRNMSNPRVGPFGYVSQNSWLDALAIFLCSYKIMNEADDIQRKQVWIVSDIIFPTARSLYLWRPMAIVVFFRLSGAISFKEFLLSPTRRFIYDFMRTYVNKYFKKTF